MEFFTQDYLEHHGIQGQKWGHRRFQNEDGTLTEAGRKRYHKLQRYQADEIDYLNRRSGTESVRLLTKATKLQDKAAAALRNNKSDKALKYSDKADKEYEQYNKLVDDTAKAYADIMATSYEQMVKESRRSGVSALGQNVVRASFGLAAVAATGLPVVVPITSPKAVRYKQRMKRVRAENSSSAE